MRRPTNIARATSINHKVRLTLAEQVLAVYDEEPDDPVADPPRPKTRGDCAGVPRPCPFAACKYHLYVDVNEEGTLKVNFPDRGIDEIPYSCSLDVADAGMHTLDEIGDAMNITRERVRQIDHGLRAKLGPALVHLAPDDWDGEFVEGPLDDEWSAETASGVRLVAAADSSSDAGDDVA